LAVKVEDDLLIQTNHFYLLYNKLKKEKKPFEEKTELKIKNLLKMRTFKVADEIFDIKEMIEEELHKILYNKACNFQNNYTTYEIIRSVAKCKFDLNLGHSYIPFLTLGQGNFVFDR